MFLARFLPGKRIICLANSRIGTRRCIAGKEYSETGIVGAWVRPVVVGLEQGLSEKERFCPGHGEPQLLDVVKIPCARPHPMEHQQENCALRTWFARWSFAGRFPWQEVGRLLDTPEVLWVNGDASHGAINNRVAMAHIPAIQESLYLIRPERMRLQTVVAAGGKSRLMAAFRYRDLPYQLAVTDPVLEAHGGDGVPLEEAVLCLSLGEPFKGHCYKLVAAILHQGRF